MSALRGRDSSARHCFVNRRRLQARLLINLRQPIAQLSIAAGQIEVVLPRSNQVLFRNQFAILLQMRDDGAKDLRRRVTKEALAQSFARQPAGQWFPLVMSDNCLDRCAAKALEILSRQEYSFGFDYRATRFRFADGFC